MSCYGSASSLLSSEFNTFAKAKLQCEFDTNCIAVKHQYCGTGAVGGGGKSYVKCGLNSKIGIRMDNEALQTRDKKDCIFKKIVEGIF